MQITRPGRPIFTLLFAIVVAWKASVALGQADLYVLTKEGWVETTSENRTATVVNPITGEIIALNDDRAIVDQARRLVAEDRPKLARDLLNDWIETERAGVSPYLSEAHRIRGDALLSMGREYQSLFDYEYVIREFPASDQFQVSLEREFDIAAAYLGRTRDGRAVPPLKRKFWGGPRWIEARRTGEELLIRIQERLPASRLAELSAITLADDYFDEREMALAAEMYRIFLANFPVSEFRRHAAQRQLLATIAQYKGPAYDGSVLRESVQLIDRFRSSYPAEAEAAGVTAALASRVTEQQALQMLDAGRSALRRNDGPGACYVLRRLRSRFPTTKAAIDAYALIREIGCVLPEDVAGQSPRSLPETEAAL
ncbi:MAG: hypothetical protein AAF108_06015 [Planctomycetota bacterium]